MMIDKKDLDTDNWLLAQEGEKRFWEQITKNKKYLDVHADDFKKEIPSFLEQIEKTGFSMSSEKNILQIGCALFDLIDFIPLGKRFAIEPLEDYFSTVHDQHRDIRVERVAGKAEKLPYSDLSMDLIISHNMLDHVDSPEVVLNEIMRVTKKESRIWIQVHTFYPLSKVIKNILLQLKIDTKHLHFWTTGEILSLFKDMGLEPINSWIVPDSKSFLKCIQTGEWRPIIKKMLLIQPNRMTVILRKK